MDRTRAGEYNGGAVRFQRAFAFVLTLSLCALSTASARADAQMSVRNSMEVGKRWSETDNTVIFGAGLRGELLWGKPKPRSFRLGPAFELRSVDFRSAEGAVGAGLLIPMPGDFPFGLTGLVGYAARNRLPDAPVGIGTLTWGYRGYNYHHWYGYGLNLFVSARRDLSGPDFAEVTGGIEIDVMFTTIIPLFFVRTWATGGDPDEK